MGERDPVGLEPVDEPEHLFGGLDAGRKIGDLGADVAVDPADVDEWQAGGAAIELERIAEGHAELALLQSGRDVGVCLRIDVGVHPQRNGRAPAHAAGNGIQRLELGRRFDVEAADAGRQRRLHFGRRLAHAGKDDPRRIATGGDDPRELAAGDDVEAASETGQDVQYSEAGIRLDRVAHEMRRALERRVEGAKPGLERRARVDVTGGAEALGDSRQRHPFGVELAADNGEGGHGLRSGGSGAGVAAGPAGAASGRSDEGAPAVVDAGDGSFNGPFTPHAVSGAAPIATATANPIAARRIRTRKSRTIGAES